MQGRRRAAFGVVTGIVITATIYAVLSMAGLAILLSKVGWLARAVQIAGGLYLIYLGVSAWRSAGTSVDAAVEAGTLSMNSEFGSGIRLGAVVSFANPKSIAFFTSLYAAAIPFDASLVTKGAILFGGFSIELLWYSFAVVVLSMPHIQRAYRRWSTWIERCIGTVLAYFGVRLVLDRT